MNNDNTGSKNAVLEEEKNLLARLHPPLFFTKSSSPASCVSQTGRQERLTCVSCFKKKVFTCAWSLCNPWQRSCQQWCYPSLVLVALQAPPPPLPGLHYHRRPCVQLSVAGRPGDQADQVGLHSPLMPPADCKPPFLWAVRAEVLRWRTPAGCRIDMVMTTCGPSLIDPVETIDPPK